MKMFFIQKSIAFKASNDKKKKCKIKVEASDSDEDDDEDSNIDLALLMRRTTRLFKKLNKKGYEFSPKNNKFFSSKKKEISKKDGYNCGELRHLAHQCKKASKKKAYIVGE